MSDHAWILENLAAYLAGGLEPAERERLEQHTADCVPCAVALSDARTMETALSGLFAEARPSAALEDRMIQKLRTPPPHVWRIPVPMWLVIPAAALVLVGFTGALASQILVQGGRSSLVALEPPARSMGDTLLGYQGQVGKDVAQLADESRRSMLSRLDLGTERSFGGRSLSESDRRPNAAPMEPALDAPAQTRVFDTTRDGIESKKPESTAERHLGQLGAMGGIAAGGSSGGLGYAPGAPPPPASTPAPTGPATATYGTIPLSAFQPGDQLGMRATGLASATNGPVPYYKFEPSKQLGDNLSQMAKDQKDGDGKSGQPASGKGSSGGQGSGGGRGPTGDVGLAIRDVNEQDKNKQAAPPPAKQPQEQPGPRKIVIRTGEIEYEVQSFDAAVATVTRLIKNIKSGFIATVNSDKLANGKVRGSVVVRVPPENLDELILDLRTNLGKTGELKNQRIASLDITKQYTDLESELKAARAMEERLLNIIKSGKGEIKDLLAAEKELGNWRTRIEKIEGELRYYASQVALSTLTITLYEKEITAPFAVIEREQVQMGIEVEDVDQSYQEAQKAVREAKGRITRAELKQPSQGQFSAQLNFEAAPDAAGPLRDRLKQLGTVARFDISRQEETQGGTGAPSDAKTKRADTRFHVHFYNLMDVAPRETVILSLACVDVETAMKTLLARVEKAAGRVLSSNLTSTHGAQTQGDLLFQVKTTLADPVLEDIKSAGEVMALQVRETTNVETTRKKRGFQVKLWALEAAIARETDEMQLACADVASSYRLVQEAVQKAKGRVRIAQLNEQDRRQVTATLDFDIRRADEDGVRAALLKAGSVYTRKASRAAEAENVVDTKVRWQVTFLNQANIPPRETYKYGVEVTDVDQTTAMLSALAGKGDGRIVKAEISRNTKGQVIGELVYDVPMAEVHELLDTLKSAGVVRVQQTVKHPEVPDSPLAVARLEVTLSNAELIVPSDDGFGPNVRRGLSDSFAVLSWSLRILILGLCVLLPWALVIWGLYRLVLRLRRRATPAAPAA